MGEDRAGRAAAPLIPYTPRPPAPRRQCPRNRPPAAIFAMLGTLNPMALVTAITG